MDLKDRQRSTKTNAREGCGGEETRILPKDENERMRVVDCSPTENEIIEKSIDSPFN